ncbi:MAG: bifunctional riboflavin kinase/FAD synthetase [Bacteroidia bacterium]|nr:bifunctional riboflavin kinase/FAD synthetase [Bacteroidia bacterium]
MISVLQKQEFEIFTPTAVAIGTFDGVHLGHQTILQKLKEISVQKKLASCVLTFEPHPRIVLGKPVQLLTTIQEKISLLEQFGVDLFVAYPFTEEFSELSPTEYVESFLLNKMQARHLLVGYDHRFGKNREGDVEMLKKVSSKLSVGLTVVDPVQDGAIAVSSTRIRKFISEGMLKDAARLLGYQYSLSGFVVKGENRGKKIGFPTANLRTEPFKLLPPNGVYACLATIENELSKIPAAVNIGTNPTFSNSQAIKIEAHLLSENIGNLYGRRLKLEFVERIRCEVKFSDFRELTERIKEDIAICRELLVK